MLESAWLFVGLAAFAWTLVTLGVAMYTDPMDDMGDTVATMAGAIGTVAWGVWIFGAFDVRVVGDSVTYTFNMPAVAILGLAFALIPFYIFLTGPIQLARRATRATAEDV